MSRPQGLAKRVRGVATGLFTVKEGGETATAMLTRRMTFPTVLISVLALLTIGYLFILGARDRDEAAVVESIRSARAGMVALEHHLSHFLRIEFDHLIPAAGSAAEGRVAPTPYEFAELKAFGIDQMIAFDATDRPIARHRLRSDGEEAPPPLAFDATLERLLAASRQVTSSPPTPVTGLITLDDRVHLVAAAAIDPARYGAALGDGVLVIGRPIDGDLLAELAEDRGLSQPRFVTQGRAAETEAALSLFAFGSDEVIGHLLWTPPRPGQEIMIGLMPPVAAASAATLMLLVLIQLDARRAGRGLDKATAQLAAARQVLEQRVAHRTARLQAAESRLRGIFDNAVEGIFQIAPQGHFLDANVAMAQIFGFESVSALIAEADMGLLFVDGKRQAEFTSLLARTGQVRDFVSAARRQDGTQLWIAQNTRVVRDESGKPLYYEGMVADITQRKHAEDRLLHNALHDPLTGLPNRTKFLDALSYAIRRSQSYQRAMFAVLFLDCDHFKLINDSLGHGAGDRLLVLFAHRLQDSLPENEILARLGGDEFAVLIEGESAARDALWAAEMLHAVCRQPIRLDGRDVFLSVSIGLAVGNPDYQSPGEVLRDADIAMYRAKAAGRGSTARFERGMHFDVMSRLQLETELRGALMRGDFALRFQPIVILTNGALAGFEALIRWHHRERGIVAPEEFIPVAEETGLIRPLGDWVLAEATRQLALWRHAGLFSDHLFVAVNLSPSQLAQPDLVERVRHVLAAADLPAQTLKLEITESTILSNPEDVQAKIRALSELGVRLCVDDFGTGYSSLSQLHAFSFDTLKIDRSFISRLASGEGATEIVRTILMLGRALKLNVVAEGVETPLQRDWLRACGCPYAQGHLFAKPLSASEAGAWLARECDPMAARVVND